MINQPVIIIGLDAATFDVIGPWIKDGTLPTLQRLIKEGSSGRLRSTLQPTSPVAWTSAVTGKSPGKHGIFDWRVRQPQNYHADIVNSNSVNIPTLWQIVNQADRTAGVVNVPLTYPPKPLNGYLVTDILTPSNAEIFTYPPELSAELHQAADGYRIFFGQTYREGEEERFLQALHSTLEKRKRAVLHLLRHRPTDFTMVVFMESDHIQHEFWKYMDTTFPNRKPAYDRYQHAIRDLFVALDNVVGEMLAALPADTTTFIMSDHGFGPLHKIVYLEKYFIQRGLMRLKSSPVTQFKRWLLENNVPMKTYQLAAKFGLDIRQWVPKKQRTQAVDAGMSAADIDWSRTKAYSCGDFGQIALNLQGREQFGSVAPADYETVRNEVITALQELRDPETNERVVDKIYRREEIYFGPYADTAPDIIFFMKNYSYSPSRSLGLHSNALMEPHHLGKSGNSGTHAMDGIIIAHGPFINKGVSLNQANLIDLTPTVLYAMGLPILDDMDGQVLTQLFTPDHLAKNPIQSQKSALARPLTSEAELTAEDNAEIERRLKDLGYLG